MLHPDRMQPLHIHFNLIPTYEIRDTMEEAILNPITESILISYKVVIQHRALWIIQMQVRQKLRLPLVHLL